MIMVVEMPRGTSYKYEMKGGKLVLDRVLSHKVPFNYGYLEGTKSKDGDPTDVFLIDALDPIFPTTGLLVTTLMGLRCDDNGVEDNKFIAVHDNVELDPSYLWGCVSKITEYLESYKKGFKVLGIIEESELANYPWQG